MSGSPSALKGTGYHYAPDPSSQGACTIGGNVATNSGGPHTLKYGVTVNHVLGRRGGAGRWPHRAARRAGEDHPGPRPGRRDRRQRRDAGDRHQGLGAADARSAGLAHDAGDFESVDDATNAISEIIGAGIVPAALEMMDQGILVARRGGVSLRLSARRPGDPADRSRWPGSGARRSSAIRSSSLCQQVRRARSAAGRATPRSG